LKNGGFIHGEERVTPKFNIPTKFIAAKPFESEDDALERYTRWRLGMTDEEADKVNDENSIDLSSIGVEGTDFEFIALKDMAPEDEFGDGEFGPGELFANVADGDAPLSAEELNEVKAAKKAEEALEMIIAEGDFSRADLEEAGKALAEKMDVERKKRGWTRRQMTTAMEEWEEMLERGEEGAKEMEESGGGVEGVHYELVEEEAEEEKKD